MELSHINELRKNLIMAAYADVKLSGHLSVATEVLAEKIKKLIRAGDKILSEMEAGI